VRWPGSALAYVRDDPHARIASQAQQLDSQLNGSEEQVKAAPGRRTPKSLDGRLKAATMDGTGS